MGHRVCIFWDNSNIFIGGQYIAAKQEGPLTDTKALRIHFEHLFDVARGGRDVEVAFCVGSVPPELEQVWQRLRDSGVEVELFERGKDSGKEQAVDQALQVRMLRAMVDVSPPGIAVLLTGDGAGYSDGVGFHADLERMRKQGWGIEVLSWSETCNKKLMAWAKDNGEFVNLDDWYPHITYVKQGRPAKNVTVRRKFASPSK